MAKIGVMLAGCGVEDGSEVYEAVLTVLALERAGATVEAIAPDIEQAEVINHYTGQQVRIEKRSVLAESARIVRGKIRSAHEVSAHDLDALILIGGYGAVKNLCSYAANGVDGTVNIDVERLIQELNGLGKPIGAMCAAPMVVALALRHKHPSVTIGADGPMAVDLLRIGATSVVRSVGDIHIDETNHLVTTPAFMLAQTAAEAEPGITKLVNQIVRMVHENSVDYRGDGSTNSASGA